jgi:hypothetical protein
MDNAERLSGLARNYCGWVDAIATLFVRAEEDVFIAASPPTPIRIKFGFGVNSINIELESSFDLESNIFGYDPMIRIHLAHDNTHVASISINRGWIMPGQGIYMGKEQ